ncbi:MAG TPA: cysteine--tRNA ligase, partial [Chlorobaculum parvum]|nr:cysteine--tRNA ligase [Chlorobaculum parvum]
DAASKAGSLQMFDTYAAEVLGILKSRDELLAGESGENAQTLDDVMQVLLELRKEARANKDFATSDKIRDLLLQKGIEVKDTKEGATWSKKKA